MNIPYYIKTIKYISNWKVVLLTANVSKVSIKVRVKLEQNEEHILLYKYTKGLVTRSCNLENLPYNIISLYYIHLIIICKITLLFILKGFSWKSRYKRAIPTNV